MISSARIVSFLASRSLDIIWVLRCPGSSHILKCNICSKPAVNRFVGREAKFSPVAYLIFPGPTYSIFWGHGIIRWPLFIVHNEPWRMAPHFNSLILELESQLCHQQALLLLCQVSSLWLLRFVIGPVDLTEMCLLPTSSAVKWVLCSDRVLCGIPSVSQILCKPFAGGAGRRPAGSNSNILCGICVCSSQMNHCLFQDGWSLVWLTCSQVVWCY